MKIIIFRGGLCMKLKIIIFLFCLLFILISGCETKHGNLEQFLEQYPILKKEADKIDPEMKEVVLVPLKFPFVIHEMNLDAELGDPKKKSTGFNIELDTRVGKNFEHISIHINNGMANY